MKSYKFTYNNKEFELTTENCSYVMNDEQDPIDGLELDNILEMLAQQVTVDFDMEYYEEPCQNCFDGKAENNKAFKFLEYHFYIFTKKGKYVISSISKEYEDTSFNKLLKKGLVDNSYIASIIVCAACGDYSIEIEQCEV